VFKKLTNKRHIPSDVLLAKSGCKDAFSRLMDEHVEMARRVIYRITFNEIIQALTKLPELQRAAITLTALEGKTVKETAYILNCTSMSIYWHLEQTQNWTVLKNS
jgi:DNA-directed RNA polymerase specialized sigma subunit